MKTEEAIDSSAENTAEPVGKMSLWSHVSELRSRLIRALIIILIIFIICFFGLSRPLYAFLAEPMRAALETRGSDSTLYFSDAFSPITVQIRLSFLAALFFGFPFFAYQIWGFIAPGLYKKEKQITLPIVIGTPLLFFLGALFARYLMFPIAFNFAISFASADFDPLIDMGKHLTTSIRLILAFGICFELPLLLAILNLFSIVSVAQLKSWRRYFVLVAAVVGAILTPSDLLSMLLLAGPLLILYEISIILCHFLEKRRENATNEN